MNKCMHLNLQSQFIAGKINAVVLTWNGYASFIVWTSEDTKQDCVINAEPATD